VVEIRIKQIFLLIAICELALTRMRNK